MDENFEPCEFCGVSPCVCNIDVLKAKLRFIKALLKRNGVVYDIPRGRLWEDVDFKSSLNTPDDFLKIFNHEPVSVSDIPEDLPLVKNDDGRYTVNANMSLSDFQKLWDENSRNA